MAPASPLPRRLPPHGLYAITDGPRGDLLAAAEAALQGGAALLALRARFDVPLIVNDDVELARESGAAGVHLGEDDPGIAQARKVLGPDAVIGVSCYDSLQRARDAAAAGADYLAFGAFFPSPTKPH